MGRRKKKSLFWRSVKALFRGLWWGISTLAYYVGLGMHKSSEKIKEKRKKKKLEQLPSYNKEAHVKKFSVVTSVSGDYDEFHEQLHHSSLIALIFGKRGSGKSALGFRIMENLYAVAKRPCFVLGVKQELLPKWIVPVLDIEEVHDGGVVLVDEGALSFSSRDSMAGKNKALGKLLAIARHKDLTLLFITQNTGMIDANVLKLVDTLFIKEGSLLQLEMERTAIKKFYKKAMAAFKNVSGSGKKYVYVMDGDFEGLVSVELPGFWSSKVSKSRA